MASRFLEHEAANASFEESASVDGAHDNLSGFVYESSFIVEDSQVTEESTALESSTISTSSVEQDEVALLVAEARKFIGTSKSTLKTTSLLKVKPKIRLIQPMNSSEDEMTASSDDDDVRSDGRGHNGATSQQLQDDAASSGGEVSRVESDAGCFNFKEMSSALTERESALNDYAMDSFVVADDDDVELNDDFASTDSSSCIDSEVDDDADVECSGDENEDALSTHSEPKETKNKHGSAILSKRALEELVPKLTKELDETVFSGKLNGHLTIEWSDHLRTTAGTTRMHKGKDGQRSATIQLARKVLDDADRLKSTLAHEMCHAAQWVVDDCSRPMHGRVFKKWASKANRVFTSTKCNAPPVTTKHSFSIYKPFRFSCSNCHRRMEAHSKGVKKPCKRCKVGEMLFVGKFDKAGNRIESRAPSAFALFVKAEYQKARQGSESHASAMAKLAQQWTAQTSMS